MSLQVESPGFPRQRPPTRPRGFTLIEVMVVVTIIGILASIAIPQMQLFVVRAKRAERDMMLRAIQRSIADYLVSNSSVTTLTLKQNPSNNISEGKKPFQRSLTDWDRLPFAPEGGLYFRYSGSATLVAGTGTITLIAQGDVDADGSQSTRTMTFTLQSGQWMEFSVTDSGDADEL